VIALPPAITFWTTSGTPEGIGIVPFPPTDSPPATGSAPDVASAPPRVRQRASRSAPASLRRRKARPARPRLRRPRWASWRTDGSPTPAAESSWLLPDRGLGHLYGAVGGLYRRRLQSRSARRLRRVGPRTRRVARTVRATAPRRRRRIGLCVRCGPVPGGAASSPATAREDRHDQQAATTGEPPAHQFGLRTRRRKSHSRKASGDIPALVPLP